MALIAATPTDGVDSMFSQRVPTPCLQHDAKFYNMFIISSYSLNIGGGWDGCKLRADCRSSTIHRGFPSRCRRNQLEERSKADQQLVWVFGFEPCDRWRWRGNVLHEKRFKTNQQSSLHNHNHLKEFSS
ncbi:unnamed protein product [Lactuca virosa]|uniref:Uncharacterized protein n=1 Tax=Lactuca virosa TaxID=75947 RepID=A0AAU9PE34_9ASTR|nr:unnamed protein product [Lactuca virosa]